MRFSDPHKIAQLLFDVQSMFNKKNPPTCYNRGKRELQQSEYHADATGVLMTEET